MRLFRDYCSITDHCKTTRGSVIPALTSALEEFVRGLLAPVGFAVDLHTAWIVDDCRAISGNKAMIGICAVGGIDGSDYEECSTKLS